MCADCMRTAISATVRAPPSSLTGLFDFANDAPFWLYAGVDPISGSLAGTPRKFRSTEVGWFIQDHWKLHPHFTLDLGVRWISSDRLRKAATGCPTSSFPTREIIFNGLPTLGWAASTSSITPTGTICSPHRLAWDIGGDSKTALRGGYGVSYDKLFFNVGANARFNPPFFGIAQLSPFFGDTVEFFLGDDPTSIFGGFPRNRGSGCRSGVG